MKLENTKNAQTNWFPTALSWSLAFQNRKLKSKLNQNLIKNIIFMIRQFNLTSYFLRIET